MPGSESERRRERALGEGDDDFDRGVGALARLDHVVPSPASRIGQDVRASRRGVAERSPYCRSGRRPRENRAAATACRLSRRRHDLLALGEAIGVARVEPRAEGAGVHREAGVGVGVAEERPGREVASGPGRIRPLGGKDLLGRRLVERADVGDKGVLGKGRQGEAEAGQAGEQNLGEHPAISCDVSSSEWICSERRHALDHPEHGE